MVWKAIARNLANKAPVARASDPAITASLRARLAATRHAQLGHSLSVLHVAAGSCNGCELELNATQNLIYDLTQYGLSFTASPRHADILLITGVAGRNMLEAVRQTRAAMPDPVLVIAVGDCAVDGGVFKGSPMVAGGADAILPPDLIISGCPPAPAQILEGLLALLQAQAG